MASIHDHLKHLSPTDFSAVPSDGASLADFIREALSHGQALVDSVPPPPAGFAPAAPSSSPNVASSLSDVTTNSELTSEAASTPDLRKQWGKPLKLSARDNPLHIAVYKMAAADRRGAWFARRSVHEGFGFARWKRALDAEFEESLEAHGEPGQGNVRGIGGEKQLMRKSVDGVGEVGVMQLTAKFPGPSTQRDFVELLVSSTTPGAEEGDGTEKQQGGDKRPRQYLMITRPVTHPDAPERSGWVRGQYESVEFIREIPARKMQAVSTTSLPAIVNESQHDSKQGEEEGEQQRTRSKTDANLADGKDGKISVEDAQASIESGQAHGHELPATKSEGKSLEIPVDEDGELSPHPVEWIMITRSDPGGSVPKFMVERGTPSAIVSDAGKFLDWATQKEVLLEETDQEEEETEQPDAERDSKSIANAATASAAARHAHARGLTRTVTAYSSSSASSSDSFVSADSGAPTIKHADSGLATSSGSDKYAHQENELQKKLEAKKAREGARLEESKAKHGDNEIKIRKAEEKHDRKTQEADAWFEKEMGKVQERRAKDERKQAARERKERRKAEAGDIKLQLEHLKEENEELRKEVEKLKASGAA